VERSESEALQRLADAVRGRRNTLGLTQRDVVDAGGPAMSTLRQIEAAKSPGGVSRSTTSSLDRALRWAPGTAQAMLSGTAEPEPLDTHGWPSSSGDWAAYVRRRANSDVDVEADVNTDARQGTPLASYSDAQLIAELARRLAERGERSADDA
jgi:hypothetical protein